jgi:hypothetical protein
VPLIDGKAAFTGGFPAVCAAEAPPTATAATAHNATIEPLSRPLNLFSVTTVSFE